MLPVYFLAFFSEIIAELELKPNIARWILNLSSVLCGQGPLIVRPQVQKPSHLSAQPVKAPPVKPGTQVLCVICQQPICGNVWPYVCVLHTSCPLVLIGPVWTSSRTSSAVTTAGGYLGQPAAIFQKHGEVLSPPGQLFDGIFYKLP